MKKILLFAILLCNISVFAQTTDPGTTPTDCTNAFFKAMLDEDGMLIGKATADDFVIISYDGLMAEKDLLLQGINGGFVNIETGSISGVRVRTYADVAVITGSWNVKGSIQGNPLTGEIMFSAVCVKTAGNWKMVNMQFTPNRQ